jgi:L-ascorbate metabolism protein UlaG (beta-lactamase superfamily)
MSIEKTPQPNTIFFTWFNQYAGVVLKTPSKTLVIDPVDIKPKKLQTVDAILITHEHYDHLDPPLVAEIQKETGAVVIADLTSCQKLQNLLPKNKLLQTKQGDENNIGEVTIKTQKAKHPALSPVTYIITSEDNLKTYHTADSLPFPELAKIGAEEKFDLVFCTVGIAPGANSDTGFEIALLTKPHIAVPYHTESALSQKEFAKLIEKRLPETACLIPEQNKVYQVTKRKENEKPESQP